MYKPGELVSVKTILLAVLAACQLLIASGIAAAAEGPEGDTPSVDRPRRVHEPASPKAGNDQAGPAVMSLIGPRKGEIFQVLGPAGLEARATGLPVFAAFKQSGPARLTMIPAAAGWPEKTEATAPGGKPAPSRQKPNTVASTIPMTAGEKFGLFATKSFKPPAPYALSILSGVWVEAIDSKHKKPHRSAGDFAADSLTHAARSYAFRVTSNFFEKFAYPVAFGQDPRYHRSPYRNFGDRLKYAVTRVFVTQGDRNGRNEFNISFLAGGLTAAGLSNLWEPTYHQNAADTMARFGTHVGLRALTNILNELIGGQ